MYRRQIDLVYAEPVVIVGALETLVPGLTPLRAAARGGGGQGRGRARRPTRVDNVWILCRYCIDNQCR